MHVIASFQHSTELELALLSLEQQGIPRDQIIAVPLQKRQHPPSLFDSIHGSDGISLFDAGIAWGTVISILGAIYGFVLAWGPIIWGLIGAVAGFVFGFIIDLSIHRKRRRSKAGEGKAADVFVIVACAERQAQTVEGILWDHSALGIAKLDYPPDDLNQANAAQRRSERLL